MRRDKVYPKEWALLWKEVEERMTELEKKLIYSPNRDLVSGEDTTWRAQTLCAFIAADSTKSNVRLLLAMRV